MKTKLTLVCLLFSFVVTAQVTNLPTVLNIYDDHEQMAFNVIPACLSYDGTNRVYIHTDEDQVAIYSNAFTPVKSISITPTRREEIEVTYTREVIEQEVILSWHGDKSPMIWEVPESWTIDDVRNYLDTLYANEGLHPGYSDIEIIAVVDHPDGGIMLIEEMDNSNYFEYELFGKQYPMYYYWWDEGVLYECYNVSWSLINASVSDWTESNRRAYRGVQTWGLNYINYDNAPNSIDPNAGDGLCLTQTLFNDDEKYEYLYFPISEYKTYASDSNEPCANDDCLNTERREWQLPVFTSFNVLSEDGTTLQSVSFPTGFQMIEYVTAQIIKLSDEYYIICTGELSDASAMLVYKINRTGSGASVQQVSEPQQISGTNKFLRRGNVYIKHGNRTVTIQGLEVK